MYCGQGKGKTAAALGWSVMKASEGRQVFIISFLKARSTYQMDIMKRLEPDIQIFVFDRFDCNYDELTPEQQQDEKEHIRNGINFARKVLDTGECDVLVLDEILDLAKNNLVTEDELVSLVQAADDDMEVILTGCEKCEKLWPYVNRVVELDSIRDQ